jgi:hypothetical protein
LEGGNVQEKCQQEGQQKTTLTVSLDNPPDLSTQAKSFSASGGYTSTYGTTYITCTIQGKTFNAVLGQGSKWSCTSIAGLTSTQGATTPLTAHIYPDQGQPEADSATHHIIIS